MTSCQIDETRVETYMFKFPNKKSREVTDESDNLLQKDSFPVITPVSNPTFGTTTQSSLEVGESRIFPKKSWKTKNESTKCIKRFRSRNSFIIARGTLNMLVKTQKISGMENISKTISKIWKCSNKSIHNYYSYLSSLEASWYSHSSQKSVETGKEICHTTQFLSFANFKSAYAKDLRRVQSSRKKPTPFRVTKEKYRIVRNIRDSNNDCMNFQVNSILGIFAEDIFIFKDNDQKFAPF